MEYEINSFVCKFNELWSRGEQTKLSIQSNQGRASLHLELDLGLSSRTHGFNRNGPSRQRRRERRTENRENNSTKNTEIHANNPVETTAVVIETAENADTSVTKITEKVINTTVVIDTAEKADIPVTNKTEEIINTTKKWSQ